MWLADSLTVCFAEIGLINSFIHYEDLYSASYLACTTVVAAMPFATKDLYFAIRASESNWAVTRIAAFTRVLARGAIRARIVISTEVEIYNWKTNQTVWISNRR